MKMLLIAWKEIVQSLRDRKTMMLMVLQPIISIVVLGAAFSGSFNDSWSMKGTKVLYSVKGSDMMKNSFSSFNEEFKKLGVEFEEAGSKEKAINAVKTSDANCYVELDEQSGKASFYKNSKYNMDSSVMEVAVDQYVKKYNVACEIAKVNPACLESLKEASAEDLVTVTSFDKNRTPRAKDYYSVTMLTMIIFYGIFSGIYAIGGEAYRNTLNRMLVAPVGKFSLMCGKVVGSVLAISLQAIAVILTSKFLLGAYWGNNMPKVLLLLFTQVIMAVSIGMAISFTVKKEGVASALVNVYVPLATFFGGGYAPLNDTKNMKALDLMSKLSPIKWNNDAAFGLIYGNNVNLFMKTMTMNLSVALVLLLVSIFIFRKEEV